MKIDHHPTPLIEAMAPFNNRADFLRDGVAAIPIESLAVEDRTCPICYEAYDIVNPGGHSTSGETPVRIMVCSHVFGEQCLTQQVNGLNVSSRRCPMCRTFLYGAPSRASATPQIFIEDLIMIHEGFFDAFQAHRYRIESLKTTKIQEMSRIQHEPEMVLNVLLINGKIDQEIWKARYEREAMMRWRDKILDWVQARDWAYELAFEAVRMEIREGLDLTTAWEIYMPLD